MNYTIVGSLFLWKDILMLVRYQKYVILYDGGWVSPLDRRASPKDQKIKHVEMTRLRHLGLYVSCGNKSNG